MKGAYWNIRGLNKTDRSKTICDLVKMNNLDFLVYRRVRRKALMLLF
jgi:hypothetical protein